MRALHGKLDRKIVERNRRMHMKNLCFQLQALIPKPDYFSKDMSQCNLLDQATKCIQDLKEKIERLKKLKEFNIRNNINDYKPSNMIKFGFELPVINVRNHEKNLEVLLISGLEKRFDFHEVICILEEVGAEVMNANFSIVDNNIFCIIHSQAISSGIGLEASILYERLHQLIA
ncbi:uncharacterized protein LOC110019306 [Phalaenopsis equestris]|uniref:uncharacterized protein LOC110019306 n=1 Tax=Phalaenopsis equestris TaxID=78828 RepID=UPI0009E56072|nr:uncharacterized protein LOC110019306 [Phalaenopsis equestris]